MTYSQFISKAKNLTVHQMESGIWFVEPEWRDIICREISVDVSELEDSYISDWWDVENILRLEADRRNAYDSKKEDVINWLYDLITAKVEPAMMQEETDFIKQTLEFMKQNHANSQVADNVIPFPITENKE